jgi:hypothetical protein
MYLFMPARHAGTNDQKNAPATRRTGQLSFVAIVPHLFPAANQQVGAGFRAPDRPSGGRIDATTERNGP